MDTLTLPDGGNGAIKNSIVNILSLSELKHLSVNLHIHDRLNSLSKPTNWHLGINKTLPVAVSGVWEARRDKKQRLIQLLSLLCCKKSPDY